MTKYRRRPVEVEAVQWNGQPVSDLPRWCRHLAWPLPNLPISVWLIKNEWGKVEHLSNALFRAAYEPMEE